MAVNYNDFCCLKTCKEKYEWNPPSCVVSGFAGIWNNSIKVLHITDKQFFESPNLLIHSTNANYLTQTVKNHIPSNWK